MITTVIFDIGKVLVDYDWDDYLGGLFDGDKKTIDAVLDAFFGHGIWDEVDRGVWTDEQIVDALTCVNLEYSVQIKKAWDMLGTAIEKYNFTDEWLDSLKRKGYRCLYLSNWSHYLRKECKETLSFINKMDGGVFSFEVKVIKPDRRIYQEIAEKYNLIPEECVFLDDKKENIEAAVEFGFNGIIVSDHMQAARELEELLKK